MQLNIILLTLASVAFVSANSYSNSNSNSKANSKAKTKLKPHHKENTTINATNVSTTTTTRAGGVVNGINIVGAAAAIAAGAVLL
ncbi:hypothetical protein KGF56_004766 [Candida oxycetoniae]|uniref:Uncharacterized protein n=1 Tax=Candida oxycetoniae TaxID=497107 RepID=A0AAI9SSF4_9ASCO|nr:uncharacterized protein KGF56_004766 [Candida oxycetoniae]KAI3402358.1 hypothetical protein KGF56_004766 [Candida oxycetoniae]